VNKGVGKEYEGGGGARGTRRELGKVGGENEETGKR
jgi:hypothetical protein